MLFTKQLSQILLPLETSHSSDDTGSNQTVNQPIKQAGVLLPLFFESKSQQWQLILTRRAEHLKHHPGQISFPGGRFEAEDKNLHTTALRETHEEIGIEPFKVTLLGRLPQQQTTSQYHVTPFVGLVSSQQTSSSSDRKSINKSAQRFDFINNINIDKNEVAEAFYLPLDYVCDPSNQQKVSQEINGKTYRFYQILYKEHNIWGATASIIVNFSKQFNQINGQS